MAIETIYRDSETDEIFDTYEEAFNKSPAGAFKEAMMDMDFIYHCDEENWGTLFEMIRNYFNAYFEDNA